MYFAICDFYFLRYQKIKIDKTKLLNVIVAKRSTFDSLHKKMEKIIPSLKSGERSRFSFCFLFFFEGGGGAGILIPNFELNP